MAILKTPDDLGSLIRQRRKALGWDQARLAHDAGVSRQWVIEVEKGKPRAELQLVLRVMNVLGIPLMASTPVMNRESDVPQVDINEIVDRHRAPRGQGSAQSNAGTLSYAEILERARQMPPPGVGAPVLSVHETPATYRRSSKKKP
ncbi:type II toxin-antitoxin system Y4mF family antitoxin [Stenotrophomonas bentonitica]|uniref:helix-turn-helix transcriptional regulator n=1 Tax=Stenotrophomonas bentonitica TaxID=1450134 RepID=UPI00345ED4A5